MKNEIRFTLESKQRPKLAQEIGNILGAAPHYERVPSCAYDIAGYRLDKLGSTVAKRNEKLVKLLNGVGEMNLGEFHCCYYPI